MNANPFAALLGQSLPAPDIGTRRVHRAEAPAPSTKTGRAPHPRRAPVYASPTERVLLLVRLMADGEPRSLRQMADHLGAGSPENLRGVLHSALDVGLFVPAGELLREDSPGTRGKTPTLYRMALPE